MMIRIKKLLNDRRRRRRRRRGVLTLEWILLITVLVIGIIGGLGVVRDALISELKDLAECIEAINICDDEPPCVCDITDPNCCMP